MMMNQGAAMPFPLQTQQAAFPERFQQLGAPMVGKAPEFSNVDFDFIKEQEGLKFFKLGITFSSIFKKADLLAFSINFEKFKPLEIHNLSRSYEDFDLNKVFIIAIIKK